MLKSEIKPFSDVVCANDSHSNYGWMNAKTGVLRLIDLNSGKLSKEIDLSKIDSSLYYKSNPTKIFIHNLDSIFILPQESKIIYLVDGNGDRINSWEIPFAGIQEDFVLSGFGTTVVAGELKKFPIIRYS